MHLFLFFTFTSPFEVVYMSLFVVLQFRVIYFLICLSLSHKKKGGKQNSKIQNLKSNNHHHPSQTFPPSRTPISRITPRPQQHRNMIMPPPFRPFPSLNNKLHFNLRPKALNTLRAIKLIHPRNLHTDHEA